MKTRENHKIIKGFRTILAAGVLGGSILAGGGVETASAGDLQLCAKLDRKTQAIRSGSPVKVRAECIRGELELPGEMYIVTPEIMAFLQTLGARIGGLERIIGCDKDQPDCDGDTALPGEMQVIDKATLEYLSALAKRVGWIEDVIGREPETDDCGPQDDADSK